MKTTTFFVIGVMSGTSLDGMDLAYLRFTQTATAWSYEILKGTTVPYPENWVEKLKNGIHLDATQMADLNVAYTLYTSKTIADFIAQNAIEVVDAVCSHGHTIWHQPQNGITLQIGNLPQIQTHLPHTVVCDFRVQDVALGGQGAPLVPMGDALLFADYDFCLNLGGFSNISYQWEGRRIAYDISAVNTVLNHYANILNQPYDDGGRIAASGKLHQPLYDALNALPYYQLSFPKSLGFEYVKDTLLPLLESYKIEIPDLMHTFTKHVGYQIARALPYKEGKLYITGGGAYNTFLLECVREEAKAIKIVVPDAETIEFKEALIFGFLGVLKLLDQNNVLSSVTGASADHSSGIIYHKLP